MKMAAAQAISDLITEQQLSVEYIIPSALDTRVPVAVAKAVAKAAIATGVARVNIDPDRVEENTKNYILERSLSGLKPL